MNINNSDGSTKTTKTQKTKVGFVGCGFVSSLYMQTINQHPALQLVGAFDINPARLKAFSTHYGTTAYQSLEELLSNSDLVVNLTSPENHYEVSKAVLQQGIPVYSEKPLTLSDAEASSLVSLAIENQTNIFSAPCVHLSEMAETVRHHLASGVIGKVYLVYAEMDDGLIHMMAHEKWINEFGAPWPAKGEFESGTTLEHAAYTLCLLNKWFGEGELKSVFQTECISDKVIPIHKNTADFSTAMISFPDNVVARITCSIVAPKDHQIRIIGEKGVITIDDVWFYNAPVKWQNFITIRRKTLLNPLKRKLKTVKTPYPHAPKTAVAQMDFCRGIQHLADQVAPDPDTMASMLNINSIMLTMNGEAEGIPQHPWLILGTGNMAQTVVACLQRNSYPIQGAYSATEGRALSFCNELGLAKHYTNLNEIPHATTKTIAYVASVNKDHYVQTKALLSKGYDVLCEKPLTMSSKQTEELYLLATQKGTILQENLWSLFVPAARQIHAQCQSQAELELAFHSDIPYTPDSRQWQPEAGGCLYDLGIYPLAWAVYLFGEIAMFTVENTLTEHGIVSQIDLTTHHDQGKKCSIRAGFAGKDQYIKSGQDYFTPIYAPEFKSTIKSPLLRKVREKLTAPAYPSKDPYAFIVNSLNSTAADNTLDNPYPPQTSIHLAQIMESIHNTISPATGSDTTSDSTTTKA